MRLAFTIIFNGLHHLLHNDYFDNIKDSFDHWVFVEGPAKPQGSTSWCKNIPAKYVKNNHSIDGTLEWLLERESDWVSVVHIDRFWESKDEMVNAALQQLSSLGHNDGYLWEVDVDEQWAPADLDLAEQYLEYARADTGMFLCDYFVGKDLVAKGEWGEGTKEPYRRLWRWRGEKFIKHEPPILEGQRKRVLIPVRFNHFAYYFPQDVQFKDDFYKGHENIYAKWLSLQKETCFPQPISRLISGNWGKTKTEIHRI